MTDRLTPRHVAFLAVGLLAGYLVAELGPAIGGHVNDTERRLTASLHDLRLAHTRDTALLRARTRADSVALDSARQRQGVSRVVVLRRLDTLLLADTLHDTIVVARANLDSLRSDLVLHFAADSAERVAGDSLVDGLRRGLESLQGRFQVAVALGDSLGRLARQNRRGALDLVGVQAGVGLDGAPYLGIGVTVSVRRVACLALPTC